MPFPFAFAWLNAIQQYMVAFIGRLLADQNTTTNQKQAAATEGSIEGICDERDAWGKRDAIILGAL